MRVAGLEGVAAPATRPRLTAVLLSPGVRHDAKDARMRYAVLLILLAAVWLVSPAVASHSSHQLNTAQKKAITSAVKTFFKPSVRPDVSVRGIRIGNRTHWALATSRSDAPAFQPVIFGLKRVNGRWRIRAEQHVLGCPPPAAKAELHFAC